MATFDALLDDYLHAIVRSRPWAKKREEELLAAFGAWLAARPEARAGLAGVTPELAERYVRAAGLDPAEAHEVMAALAHVYAWAEYQKLIESSPFARFAAV